MLVSNYEDVRKEGHKQVVARWLFNDLFKAELQVGLESKKIESLLGYASVINQLLGDETKGYGHSKLKAIFEILVNSEDAITRVIQQLYDQAENDQDDETLSYCLDMWDELLASNHSFIRNMTEKLDGGLLA